MTSTVRIAAGQGFWGDWLEAPVRQVRGGPIDYLMMDYLAEVTMSIMQKQKSRDPSAGYARDFVPLMERILPDVVERVIVLPTMAHERFLGLLATSDVVLDTPHFNGYNSSLEAFAVGTPIVTRPGPLQRMRHTAGMYAAMGMTELCASSDQEYVRLALEVAHDSERRAAYSRTIREREAALFEDLRVVRGYEAFFERVRGGYAMRRVADPERFVVLDASHPPDEVWAQIEGAIQERSLW